MDEGWGGYAKLFRIIKTRSWYKNRNATLLYVNCVLNASFEAGTYMGIHYKKGQFVSSYRKLSEETGLSIQEVRTALEILKATQDLTQEVTHHPHPKYSLFTVSEPIVQKKSTHQSTHQSTHIKEIKEGEGRSEELALPKEVVWEVPRSSEQRSNKDKEDERR